MHVWCTKGAPGGRYAASKFARATAHRASRRLRAPRGHWIYFRRDGKPNRERVGNSAAAAECIASLLNAQLVAAAAGLSLEQLAVGRLGQLIPAPATPAPVPSIPAGPIVITTIEDLRRRFLEHHEKVLDSSLNTVSRYTTATLHLENFGLQQHYSDAGGLQVSAFIQYLRTIEVSPNGHANTLRRKLRDKGILFILECCRSLYHFGLRQHLLPRGFLNPFSSADLGKVRIRDAKAIFVFNPGQELAFFQAAKPWAFFLHFVLSKTGLRPGELVRLLIEDVDLSGGWLLVRSKPELGWLTKTNRERRVPLLPEVLSVLKRVIGSRDAGVVFLRHKLVARDAPKLGGDRASLAKATQQRLDHAHKQAARPLSRREEAKIHASVWQDAGAALVGRVRTWFIQTTREAGLTATCPKSWRHTFATLLQEANVDLLVRQETLGHKPSSASSSALGMTGVYTHTTPHFQRAEISRALRLRPLSLELTQTLIQQETHNET